MKKSTSLKNLKALLKKGEGYKTEFKENKDKKLDREIVAFANSSGGKIYIGITDEGKVKGTNITNRLKSQIEDIANNCDPKISISFQEIKKEKILIVEVKASREKPHKCSSGFYVRSGSISRKLSKAEIVSFMEKEDRLDFDNIPCKEFDFKKNFDKEKLFHFMDRTGLKYSRKNHIQILENLKVIKRNGSKIIFNNAGVLFFSKNLNSLFSHTEIACGAFKGTDKVHVIDSARFNTDLIGNVEGAMSFLWKNLRARHEIVHKSAQRIDVLEIPEKALREALVNAVTHRNYITHGVFIQLEIYDDRVEISNFGGLHKNLKKSEFGKKSVTRSPLIATLMLRAKYIEQMGTGIQKMRSLVKKEGLPPIKFKFNDFTTVTFYRKPLWKKGFSKSLESDKNISETLRRKLNITIERANKIAKILQSIEYGKFSKGSLSKELKVSSRSVEKDIRFLKQHQIIQFEGSPKYGKYKVTEKYIKLKTEHRGSE